MNRITTLEVSLKQREMLRAAEQRRWVASVRRAERRQSRIERALRLRNPAGR
jgi:hypothetical protein